MSFNTVNKRELEISNGWQTAHMVLADSGDALALLYNSLY